MRLAFVDMRPAVTSSKRCKLGGTLRKGTPKRSIIEGTARSWWTARRSSSNRRSPAPRSPFALLLRPFRHRGQRRAGSASASGFRPAVQNADVIGALESWRVAEALATHLAADVADHRHAARVEPLGQVGEERAHMTDPVAQQRRSRYGAARL